MIATVEDPDFPRDRPDAIAEIKPPPKGEKRLSPEKLTDTARLLEEYDHLGRS